MSTHDLLIMVQVAVVVGIAGFVLADRLKVPAIVFLLALGVLVGPQGLGIVQPEALGNSLQVIVATAVAIIVFEGGMLLDFDEIRAASTPIRNLMTIGVFVAVVGGTLAAWLIAGLPFERALLFGALMCVTGPTVITPLLKRASVNRRVETILQSEAVLVDAIGATLAVVVLELIIHNTPVTVAEAAQSVGIRLGVGTLAGLAGGYLLVIALRQLKSLPASTVRLSALGGALAIYAAAESIAAESGIAAVALAGIVLGNVAIPYDTEIKRFKGDLTNLGIAALFILLAAGLRFETLLQFNLNGLGGIVAVVVLMLIVRPLSVFLSLAGTSVPRNEKFYIAALGPRGVVAASIATFAELQLQNTSANQNGYSFAGLVFMTIIATVVIQGLYANPLANRLGVKTKMVLIVSADEIGRELARRLIQQNYNVTLLDTDELTVDKARKDGFKALRGDGTDSNDLRRAGIEQASVFAAVTSSDRTNLLACQIAMQRFSRKDVVARVNKLENMDNFSSIGVRVVSPVVSTAVLLENLVRRPAAFELLTNQLPTQNVVEAVVNNKALTTKALKSWMLPDSVLVMLARRDGQLFVPHGETVLNKGDVLTLIGNTEDVEKSRQQIEEN